MFHHLILFNEKNGLNSLKPCDKTNSCMTIFNFNFGHYYYVTFLKRIQNFLTSKNKFKIHCIKFAKWNLFFHSKMRLLLSQLHFSFVFLYEFFIIIIITLFLFFYFFIRLTFSCLSSSSSSLCRGRLNRLCHRQLVFIWFFCQFYDLAIFYFIFISILFKHEKTIK